MNCKICHKESVLFDSGRIMNKYTIQYFRCVHCGFIQTEEPYWLHEAYAHAINECDVGIVQRNIRFARSSRLVLNSFFDPNGRFLDYGAGSGLFVRLMRDTGFDFYGMDKYTPGVFARSFAVEPDSREQFDLVTAFEVFEHMVQPLEDFETILRFSKNVLFSTLLVPEPAPKPGTWWYFGMNHGQHISFYTLDALRCLAAERSLYLTSDGGMLHLFSERPISPWMFRLLVRNRVSKILDSLLSRAPLTETDHQNILKK